MQGSAQGSAQGPIPGKGSVKAQTCLFLPFP